MQWQVQHLINRGARYIERQEFSRALECFGKAADLCPAAGEIQAYLGETYYLNREYGKALEAFARRDELVLQADNLTPYVEGYRGCILLEQKNYHGASLLLKKAVDRKIKDPEIYYNLGVLLMMEQKLPEAIGMLKKIDQLEPSFYSRKIQKLMEQLRRRVSQNGRATTNPNADSEN